MTADHYAGLILIAASLLWLAAGCVRAASEAADSERPSLPTERDCAARRLPVDLTARRLMVASDIAAVLDNRGRS